MPEDVVERLRERAKRNHRSMQGELMVILEEAVEPRKMTVEELYQKAKESGLSTGDESTGWIRKDRDAH